MDIEKLQQLSNRLDRLYTGAELVIWLFSPQQLLGDRAPATMIERGEFDEINRLLDQIDEGVYL